MLTSMLRPGQFYANARNRVVNRTGSAVTIGEIVALDSAAAQSETAAGQGVGGATGLDVPDAIFQNAVTVAAGNKDFIIGVVVDLLGDGSDNSDIEIQVLGQRVACDVNGTIAAGDRLMPTTTNKLIALTSASDNRCVGIALEANASGDGQIDCLFCGINPFVTLPV